MTWTLEEIERELDMLSEQIERERDPKAAKVLARCMDALLENLDRLKDESCQPPRQQNTNIQASDEQQN